MQAEKLQGLNRSSDTGTCHQPVHSMCHDAVASNQGHRAEKGSVGPWRARDRDGEGGHPWV